MLEELSEADGAIDPVALGGELAKPAIEAPTHLSVRIRRQVGDDAAVMAATGLGPVSKKIGKVVEVVCDRHPSLFLGDREEDRVVELSQLVARSGSEHVMAVLTQNANEATTRQIGVEQQA